MKLISMVDYVLKNKIEFPIDGILNSRAIYKRFYQKITKYAQFLKTPPELSMFVPVGENGEVLERPTIEQMGEPERPVSDYTKKYYEAQSKLLFEGFELVEKELLKSKWYSLVKTNNKKGQVYANFYPANKNNRGEFFWNFPKLAKTIEDLCHLGLTIKQEQIKKLGI